MGNHQDDDWRKKISLKITINQKHNNKYGHNRSSRSHKHTHNANEMNEKTLSRLKWMDVLEAKFFFVFFVYVNSAEKVVLFFSQHFNCQLDFCLVLLALFEWNFFFFKLGSLSFLINHPMMMMMIMIVVIVAAVIIIIVVVDDDGKSLVFHHQTNFNAISQYRQTTTINDYSFLTHTHTNKTDKQNNRSRNQLSFILCEWKS